MIFLVQKRVRLTATEFKGKRILGSYQWLDHGPVEADTKAEAIGIAAFDTMLPRRRLRIVGTPAPVHP